MLAAFVDDRTDAAKQQHLILKARTVRSNWTELNTSFTRSSKHRADIKQTSSKRPANIQQTSSRHQAGSSS